MDDLNFKKLKQSRAYQHVVDEIQAAILDGRLQPGESLPSELKLTEMFSTSRPTVREALRVLEQKGLIEIRAGAGGGPLVRAVEVDNMAECLGLFVRSQRLSLDHLMEFREGVEGQVAALAARRRTEADLARLRADLARLTDLAEDKSAPWTDFARADVEFHLALADIAANPIYRAVLEMIHRNLVDLFDWSELDRGSLRRESVAGLALVVDALEAGQAEEAARLARNHIRLHAARHQPA